LPRSTAPPLAREILEYFVRHPGGAETLEGLARWRLSQITVEHAIEEIGRALAWLSARGLLRPRPLEGAPDLYVLDEEDAGQAQRWLRRRRPRNRARRRAH
jgi:hypothetical protein